MSYDPIKWHEEEMRVQPRRASAKWVMGAGLALALAAAIALPILHTSYPVTGAPPLATTATLAFVGAAFSPFSRGIWINKAKARLDEFERNALNRATHTAYRIMALLAVLLCFWCALGTENHWPAPTQPSDWAQMAWTFTALGLVLPVFFAELIIPMPPNDEVEDDQ